MARNDIIQCLIRLFACIGGDAGVE